jgi:hypothetical protein
MQLAHLIAVEVAILPALTAARRRAAVSLGKNALSLTAGTCRSSHSPLDLGVLCENRRDISCISRVKSSPSGSDLPIEKVK